MADGDDEVGTGEQVDFTELDLLEVVAVAGGAEHDEQGVVEAFELGALVCGDGVLDGEVVEPELFGEGVDLGVGGPVEADPGDAAGVLVELRDRVGDRVHRGDG